MEQFRDNKIAMNIENMEDKSNMAGGWKRGHNKLRLKK